MKIIDGTESLSSKLISEFAETIKEKHAIISLSSNDSVIYEAYADDENLASNLLTALKSDDVNDNDIISIKVDDIELTFKGNDYKWWSKTSKRIERFSGLLSAKTADKAEKAEKETKAKKEAAAKNELTYYVAVAYAIDNCLSDIRHFQGSKAEAIEFINNDILDKICKTSVNTKIVINLAFDKDAFDKAFSENATIEEKEQYKHDMTMWYTLQELEEIGALTLK